MPTMLFDELMSSGFLYSFLFFFHVHVSSFQTDTNIIDWLCSIYSSHALSMLPLIPPISNDGQALTP